MAIKKPLRLIFTIDKPFPFCEGGAEVHAFKLARALPQEEIQVKIVCPSAKAFSGGVRRECGIRIYSLPAPFDISHKYFFGIYTCELIIFLLAQIFRYDALQFFGLRHLRSLVRFARLVHKPYFLKITSPRNFQLVSERPASRRFKAKAILHNSQGLLAPSTELYHLILAHGIPPDKVRHIPNGAEIQPPDHLDKNYFRRKLFIPKNTKLVVFVGRLHPDKNIDFLLRCWPHVTKTIPPARLLLVGDGSAREKIVKLINALHIDNSVRLCGRVTNVYDYLRGADCFVLPSKENEGCSNALLEAMSFKLACITAKCPGNMEIIRHQENGLLVDYGDIDMLSSSIVRVLLDHNLSRALGLHAFYTVQKQFSIEKSARSYREFYTTMLGNRVSSPG